MPLLDVNDRRRYDHELDLRDRGFVPLVAFDAITRELHETLPTCQVRQVVPNKQPHGRIVWTHPGPSGIDPRGLAPLAIVRVADGLGLAPLDEPLTLGQAVTWLLTADVETWLRRPQHRVLAGDCLLQSGRSRICLMHPVADVASQQVADVLGDSSLKHCARRRKATPWSTARTRGWDLAGLAVSALDATRRLARWHSAGVTGRSAWELTVNDVPPDDLPRWHDAGFTTEEAAAWSGRRSFARSVRWRGLDVAPYAPLQLPLPPAATGPAKERGLHWYARWGLAKHGRRDELVRCTLCGAEDHLIEPCRSCRIEGRAGVVQQEWASYARLAGLHPCYAETDGGPPVPCGDQNCKGSLALSAADEGVRE